MSTICTNCKSQMKTKDFSSNGKFDIDKHIWRSDTATWYVCPHCGHQEVVQMITWEVNENNMEEAKEFFRLRPNTTNRREENGYGKTNYIK